MRIVSLFLLLNIILCNVAQGQEKCATVPYMKNLLEKKGIPENTVQFEDWLQKKINKRKETTTAMRMQSATYQVPVVIHVIYANTDGTFGTQHRSISDEQIISQITVLNNDFQRLNSDASSTPSDFLGVAGSLDIDFILAKSDPEGLPTTGIIRKKGTNLTWSANSQSDPAMSELKQTSYWPAEDYLNIWVTDLSGSYLGLAQFPVSDLPGLENFQDGLSETDGLVIDYTVFGLGSLDSKYNLGRTTTHEMGHFFGLRHIWGDESGCAGTDYVNDTPNQASETYSCSALTHPVADACSSKKMYQNYMDYTDDVCMNLFTQGQVSRMISVLENSPRRASLSNSPGLVAPSGLGEDLKITSIASPSPVTCSSSGMNFTLQNLGSQDIDEFKVYYSINGASGVTQSFDNITINSGAFFDVSIPVTFEEGEQSLYIKVHSPNGFTDTNADNSDTLINILVNNNQDFIPLLEKFNSTSTSWVAFNQADGTLWEDAETNFSNSKYFKAFDNTELGEQSWLVSPILDFSSTTAASMVFDYSYRYATSEDKEDRLTILASTDCGRTFNSIDPPFDRAGQELFNASQDVEWFPTDEAHWTTQLVDLSSLAGNTQVRLAFIAENRNGNNMFVDNIEFYMTDDPEAYDIGSDMAGVLYNLKLKNNEWVLDFSKANLTLNLTEREPVNVTVLDILGKVLFETTIPYGLNQTAEIPIGLSSAGLYLIRVRTASKEYVTKTFISP